MRSYHAKRAVLLINGLILGILLGGMLALWMDGMTAARIYLAKGAAAAGFPVAR